MSYRQLIERARGGDQGAVAALLNDLARFLDAGATVPAELAEYHAGWIDEFLGQTKGSVVRAPDGWPRVSFEAAQEYFGTIETKRRPSADLPALIGFRPKNPGSGDSDGTLRWLAAWVFHVKGEIEAGRGPTRLRGDGGPWAVAVKAVAERAKTTPSKVKKAWSKYKDDAPALAEEWFNLNRD